MKMGFSRLLFLYHILLINLVSLTLAQPDFLSHFCITNTSNSAYLSNRASLLPTLATNTDEYGFYTSSQGENPNTAYGLVLCRADVALDACRQCIADSVSKLTQLCPYGQMAVGYYDNCMLRFSNESMKGVMTGDPRIFVWNDKQNVTSPEKYNETLKGLLETLRDRAASGGTQRKFASGNTTGPDSQSVYALTQCTPDLSEQNCSACLQGAIDNLPLCCYGRAGGRVIRPSCHFRYELGPFVGEIPGSPSLSPTSAPSPAGSAVPTSDPTRTTGGCGGLKSGAAVSVALALGNLVGLTLVI